MLLLFRDLSARSSLSSHAHSALLLHVVLAVAIGSLAPNPAAAQLTQVQISGPAGSGTFGALVKGLPNGNFVVSDPGYDALPATDIGAVHLYDGTTLTRIATLTGSTTGDQVGLDGSDPGVIVLPSGNYVVRSVNWDNGAASNAGALTFCDAASGCNGAVSAVNSLVGATAFDGVGTFVRVLATANGNFVVLNQSWDNPLGPIVNAGAVTFCNGISNTCTGPVTGSNSLIGVRAEDRVGVFTALTNGHYVVATRNWDNASPVFRTDAGAVTFCNGNSGCTGPVTNVNSLVGSSTNDRVGDLVRALSDGSYVVGSGTWDNALTGVVDAGAATYCSAAGSCNGLVVTSANSLTGATANDQVGGSLLAYPLPGGAYVMSTQNFDNLAGGGSDVGAMTWCGAGGTGCTGTTVTPANSLVGGRLGDLFGPSVVAAKNGSFVVGSPQWDDPGTLAGNVGAATWCSGAGHCAGLVVGPGVSLVGSTAVDNVGNGLVGLANGNYVVGSAGWNNGATADVGAATFCDGAIGCVGPVSIANSYAGLTAGDALGSSIVGLTNGNYVVGASSWNAGTTADVGAVRLCDGNVGCFGTPSVGIALVGSLASDSVGSGGITALTNGNYVVRSPFRDSGAIANTGAATWCSGVSGCVGVIAPGNSLVGSVANDQVGNLAVDALSDGNYLVRSAVWDNGAIVNAGAYTPAAGGGGTIGAVGAANSVLGTATDGITSFDYDAARARFYVGRAPSNAVTIVGVPEPGLEALAVATLVFVRLGRRRSGARERSRLR